MKMKEFEDYILYCPEVGDKIELMQDTFLTTSSVKTVVEVCTNGVVVHNKFCNSRHVYQFKDIKTVNGQDYNWQLPKGV